MPAKRKTREQQVEDAIQLLFEEALRVEGESRHRLGELMVLIGDFGALMSRVDIANRKDREAIAKLQAAAQREKEDLARPVRPMQALGDLVERELERRAG